MSVIAAVVEGPGIARIFFDLRQANPVAGDQASIERAIESATASVHADADQVPAADNAAMLALGRLE